MPSEWPTASGLDRAALCPASEALPHVRRASNRYARRGTVKHAFLEAVAHEGREKALESVPAEFREECERIDVSAEGLGDLVDSAKFSHEVTLAFDVTSGKGRVLGTGLGRDYSAATADEVVGTADVLGLTVDTAVVPDVKTGHGYMDPEKMRQLKFLSLAASAAYGKSRAVSGIVVIYEDGEPRFRKVEFDEFDLSAFELELRDILARVREERARAQRGDQLRTVEGDHCDYCPAFDYCPSKMALVRAYAAAPELLDAGIEHVTEEGLAKVYGLATALAKVNKRVMETLQQRARQKAIPLGEGMVLGVKPFPVLDADVVSMVLEGLHGPEVAKAAFESKSASKASIERALRKVSNGNGITALKDTALAAIEAAGGLSMRPDVRKRKAEPGELDAPALPEPSLVPALEASVAQAEEKKAEGAA